MAVAVTVLRSRGTGRRRVDPHTPRAMRTVARGRRVCSCEQVSALKRITGRDNDLRANEVPSSRVRPKRWSAGASAS